MIEFPIEREVSRRSGVGGIKCFDDKEVNSITIFMEIISTIWQVVLGLISGIGKAVFENLPVLLEMKKIMGYFTPLGVIAFYLGVPTVIVSIVYKLIKKFLSSR